MTERVPGKPGSWLGAGPRIGAPACVLAVLLAVPCGIWRSRVRLPLPPVLLYWAGGILLAVGIVLYAWSVRYLRRCRRRGALATHGPYAWSRNPIYASWILLLLPGIGFLSGTWPSLIPPLVAYLHFRRHIAAEETALRERFGRDYEAYARRVPRLLLPHCTK